MSLRKKKLYSSVFENVINPNVDYKRRMRSKSQKLGVVNHIVHSLSST